MRYWKGRYDEDVWRDRALRHGDESPADEDRDIRFFHVLIALQVALVSLAVLLFVDWR